MFHRTPEKYKYETSNIIKGVAELPYIDRGRLKGWVIPGGGIIKNKQTAKQYAAQMNDLMVANMPHFKRKRL